MGRGEAARTQNTNRAGSNAPAGANEKACEGRSGAEGYDFVSSDEEATSALTHVALERGCAVLFDEQPGADIIAEF